MGLIGYDEPTILGSPFPSSDRTCIIEAMCINCNKQFKSMSAVSMHLKVTAARHSVSNYGMHNKKTGLSAGID